MKKLIITLLFVVIAAPQVEAVQFGANDPHVVMGVVGGVHKDKERAPKLKKKTPQPIKIKAKIRPKSTWIKDVCFDCVKLTKKPVTKTKEV